MTPHMNRNYEKQRVSALMTHLSRDSEGVWVSCYVHRGRSYCEPYPFVTRASLARVQRVQLSLLRNEKETRYGD